MKLIEIRSKIEDFVSERYDESGGFKMSPVDYPNSTATYCALAILQNIGIDFKDKDKCVDWLVNSKINSLYSLYFSIEGLRLLGKNEKAKEKAIQNLDTIRKGMTFLKKRKVYEFEQEFKKVYYISELSVAASIVFDEKVLKEMTKHQNEDGGFGMEDHSTITSTHYSLKTLQNLNKIDQLNRKGALKYIRKCEKPEGGFVTRPENILPYIEYTYYGVDSLEALGESVNFHEEHLRFVINCLNRDGGFRRTPILGISSIENVYYATSILRKLNVEKFFY